MGWGTIRAAMTALTVPFAHENLPHACLLLILCLCINQRAIFALRFRAPEPGKFAVTLSLPPLAHLPTRVLVTGGAGFIGSALVWALNQHGVERIVIADRLGTDEKWRNLVPLKFEDYVDADDLFTRLNNASLGSFDLVLHMGACSATTERDASFLMRNNFEFTKDLALWSRHHAARFVYASSAATYGDGAAGMSDMDESTEALAQFRPLNAYGYSKQLFDQYAERAGLFSQIVGLKYFNVFGPNEAHKADMRSLVHKAFGQIASTGRVQLVPQSSRRLQRR